MNPIDQLRARIKEIDAAILRLVGERMECAAAVGSAKKQAGVPLRDWQVERAVLDHAEALARDLHVSPGLVKTIMQALVAESRAEQERLNYSSYSGEAEDILVIGGRGKMGRWFCDFFANQGHRVSVYDTAAPPLGGAPTGSGDAPAVCGGADGVPRRIDDLPAGLAAAGFAVVATPLEVVPQTIEQVADCGYRGVLFDIASLKGHLEPAMQRARSAGVAVTSIHPMFGPATRALSGQVICLCDCGDASATQRVRGFFAETAASIVELSLEQHDRIAACVLGLSHLINILFVRVLMETGHSFHDLDRVGSTTFHSQMATTATVMRDNPELYYAIQKLNPFTPAVYASLRRALDQLFATVEGADRPTFIELMGQGRNWLLNDICLRAS